MCGGGQWGTRVAAATPPTKIELFILTNILRKTKDMSFLISSRTYICNINQIRKKLAAGHQKQFGTSKLSQI